MYNVHSAAVFTIIIRWHGPLTTSTLAYLFDSPGCVPYAIFAEVDELFGAVKNETEEVSLSSKFSGWWWWWWWDTTVGIFSPMVICIQIVYIHYLQLKTFLNVYLVYAYYLLWLIYRRRISIPYSWLSSWNHQEGEIVGLEYTTLQLVFWRTGHDYGQVIRRLFFKDPPPLDLGKLAWYIFR